MYLPYIAGMTWGWTGVRGTWTGDAAKHSMTLMAQRLHVNWTAITFAAHQDTAWSTTIHYEDEPTVTDDEIRTAISQAHNLGLQVCLKPVVNVSDGTWRAHINFFDHDVPCEPTWGQWFDSYTRFIVHYARIAEDMNVAMFCIGCEMVNTDRRANQWRDVIHAVRQVYSGLITYNCDKYQEDNVTWWDAVDVISSSGYYPHGTWDTELDRIENVVRRENKPFFFMEAGCPSREGSQHLPNDWNLVGEPSGAAQAQWYDDAFHACDTRPWVRGFMLWDWPAHLYRPDEAATNDDYCLYEKPAERTVRKYYDAHRQ